MRWSVTLATTALRFATWRTLTHLVCILVTALSYPQVRHSAMRSTTCCDLLPSRLFDILVSWANATCSMLSSPMVLTTGSSKSTLVSLDLLLWLPRLLVTHWHTLLQRLVSVTLFQNFLTLSRRLRPQTSNPAWTTSSRRCLAGISASSRTSNVTLAAP